MKNSKLMALILAICLISILAVILAGCDHDENIILNDYTVKYDGQSHAVIATNDIKGDFTYRYVSKELDYDSEQAPVEVGKYTVTVSKEGYKTATCNLEITTDFLFDDIGNVVGIKECNDNILYLPSKVNGQEVKEIKSLNINVKIKEIYLPNSLDKISSITVGDDLILYISSTPDINKDIDLSNIFFNIDNVDNVIDENYFAENCIKKICIFGKSSSSAKAIEALENINIDTVYLREDSKLEQLLPSNIKNVIVDYSSEIQKNFIVKQDLIENFILKADCEILVKSDSFVNLTKITNFMPSRNVYFNEQVGIYIDNNQYTLNSENMPEIDRLIVEDGTEVIGMRQYGEINCREIVLPNTLIEIKECGFIAVDANEINLPDNLETIGNWAFRCAKIIELKLPPKLKYIGNEAFISCEKLQGEIIFPESLEYLGERAFMRCENLVKVVDNSYINIVRNETFRNCLKLEEVHLNNKIQRICQWAFSGIFSLKISLPNELKYIEQYAFAQAKLNTAITIPSEIIEIRGNAFDVNANIKSDSQKYVVESGYLIRTIDRCLMNINDLYGTDVEIPNSININMICDDIYDWAINRGQCEGSTFTINSSIKEYKYDKPIMEKGHIVIPEYVTEQPIFNVEVGGGFIYESAVPPKMPDTESLRMGGKEIIVPKGSIELYKQAFSKYLNANELISKLVEAQE